MTNKEILEDRIQKQIFKDMSSAGLKIGDEKMIPIIRNAVSKAVNQAKKDGIITWDEWHAMMEYIFE